MKNKFLGIVLGLVLFLGIAFLTFYLIKNTNQRNIQPAEVTLSFYSDWINYEGNPLADRLHRRSNLLTLEFKDKVDDILNSFSEAGYDPILCAQDFPDRVEVKDSIIEGNEATVLTEHFYSGGNKIVEVSLVKDLNSWQINDIVCQASDNLGDTISTSDKNLVKSYIRENISSLSTEEAVLGGTFYVTDIRFISDSSCLVDYEDGHIAFSALVNFFVEGDEVEIVSFEIREDGNVSFSEIGNIVLNGENWNLVYEKPGMPALRETLIFNDDSKCLDESIDSACFPVYWNNGDRAEVQGNMTDFGIEVETLRIVGEVSREIIGDTDNSIDNCVERGGEIMYPDCIGCEPYCSFIKEEEAEETLGDTDRLCVDNCGNGICEEIVCLGEGCPCPETPESCPADCS
jgi:hypothetical protein